MSLKADNLPPMSLETMRGLKAKRDKEEEIRRAAEVNNIVVDIYRRAVEYAATHQERSYEWNTDNGDPSFVLFNIPDIVEGLEPLFPDCLVEHRMIAETTDGKKYEISNMGEDELSKLHIYVKREVIAIDWS